MRSGQPRLCWSHGLRSERWGSTESGGQEDSVSADPFIRKIAEAKGTHGNIVIGKSVFLKNFYKWKLPRVQAVFKHTTTWVAGRREQLCSDVSLKVCASDPTQLSPRAWVAGVLLRLDPPPALLRPL